MSESREPGASEGGVRGFLATRDVPCPGCGYNLRGLPGATCPECRQDLKLTVGLVDSRFGALMACLAPLFAGAGATGALLMGVLILTAAEGRGPRGREAVVLIWLPLGVLLVCGAAAAGLCTRRGRVWFRGLSGEKRTGVVVVSIAVPVVCFVVFMRLIWNM